VNPNRTVDVLATSDDGLDYAASIDFGRDGLRNELFIANGGNSSDEVVNPSVLKAGIGITGLPIAQPNC
jgi:hypothetical protein